MFKIVFNQKILNNVDWSCSYKDRAWTNFNEYIEAIGIKDKTYNNGNRKIWLTKTDFKYVNPFLKQLSFESIPFDFIRLK